MSDVFTKAKRSEVMSRIRSRGNKDTELRLHAVFRAQGITGWRRQVALRYSGPGKPAAIKSVRPDFIFRAQKLAIFVDGCFWHGCPQHFRRPQTRQKFWDAKIARNQARDAEVTQGLKKSGWRVLRLWEHELAPRQEKRLLSRLRRYL